jgi:single-stranded-DNA-specific exonuclease
MNAEAIQYLAEQGTELIITCDNGISSISEIKLAKELCIDVIIIDHHEPGEDPPPAFAIVNPKQNKCTYPFKELCAAGLAYKLAGELCRKINTPYIEEAEMCVLAAMACICDIVALQDENRTLVHRGLAVLNANKLINTGLGSLITQRGYIDKKIDAFCIGFVLGPCLNATGRLDSAEAAVELLLSEGIDDSIGLAQILISLNDTRKALTKECVDRALAQLESADTTPLPKVLVLTDPTAHESVAGIVAGRLRDTTGRPTILLTPGEQHMKGSGRSIPAYNLFEALHTHRHLFIRFGGHAAAAGLSLIAENIPLLQEALNKNCTLTEEDFIPVYEIDRVLQPEEITLELSRELEGLTPFGKGNPAPLFVTHHIYVEAVRLIEAKNTGIFTFKARENTRIKGIAFGFNDTYIKEVEALGLPVNGGFYADIAYRVETNVYNGIMSVQLGIKDLKPKK